MKYILIKESEFDQLKELQVAYKKEIGEDKPREEDFKNLLKAIRNKDILFYGCKIDGKLVASCSISITFSSFNYKRSGVFEDFYILPTYRHRGIAREIIKYAYEESGVSSLIVGAADCDLDIYKALGFEIYLGNMLAYE